MTTNHTDITADILKEFAPLVDDVTDPFYEEDSSVYEMLKANIFMVLHKALTRQREAIEAEHNAIDKAAQESTAEQWEKIKEGIRKEEREELVKSLRMEKENLYEPERKKGKWDWRVQREEGYNEAVDKFNAKLDERI